MRPVERGDPPSTYTRYQDAGNDLEGRLGAYCSYCERRIETNLAVEHIQPKTDVPELRNEWSNFLLACVNCNSSKGSSPVNLEDYFWPDSDNTLRAIQYLRGGLLQPRETLPTSIQNLARKTIMLIGLDKYPGNPGREPTSSDHRWFRRQELWQLAQRDRERLVAEDTPIVRELIVENALGHGLFSIWWTVFEGDIDMRQRLRLAFLGTHSGCFDASENLVPRAGGRV